MLLVQGTDRRVELVVERLECPEPLSLGPRDLGALQGARDRHPGRELVLPDLADRGSSGHATTR